MKRRNVDTSKQPRRPLKRANKFTDSVYGSSFVYIKFVVVWMFILLADFILEFRFEYVWPFWLLIQSVYDTFKYQGLAYSVFFVCIAITSDTVCLLFIPIQWLFFMASTYVWIHYVWHTDKGICLPTVSLWLFFMYVEATMRLRDLKNSPFHIELCKPFAAHCIGHPVVTLGIGLKSYILYRLRLRTQHSVQKENDFFYELLKYALPKEMHQNQTVALPEKDKTEKYSSGQNGIISHSQSTGKKSQKQLAIQDSSLQIAELPSVTPSHKTSSNNGSSSSTPLSQRKFPSSTSSTPSGKGGSESLSISLHNTTASPEVEMKRRNTSNHKKSGSNDTSPTQASKNTSSKNSSGSNSPKSKSTSVAARTTTSTTADTKPPIVAPPILSVPSIKDTTVTSVLTNGHVIGEKLPDTHIELISTPSAIERLENTISKLKNDLQAAKKNELNTKDRLDYLTNLEKNAKAELVQLRKENDHLQTRLNNLTASKEKERVHLQTVEKRLKLETENRTNAEKQLKEERRHRKEEEEHSRSAAAAAQHTREKEAAEVLKKAKQDVEEEIFKLQKKLKLKEEECEILKNEVTELQGREKSTKESETLMSALEAMQDKNLMLENSLSAETRLKLDLFSALGDVKRQLELAHGAIYKRDAEIADLKARLTEFLSIVPESRMRSATPHYSNNFLEKPLVPITPAQDFANAYCAMPARTPNMTQPAAPLVPSGPQHVMEQSVMNHLPPMHLDPNAAMYTPNTSGV